MSNGRIHATKAFLLVLVLLLAAATFWPALRGPFLFDDFSNLGNLAALDGMLDWPHLRDYLASFPGPIGRPLSALSFVLNDYGWPSDPSSFKRTNLLIHLLNGVLVFGLSRGLANLVPAIRAKADWIALATMLVWLVHPIQISASMFVVQRMTLLAACFGLGGLWSYVALARRATSWRGAAAAIVALGVGTVLATLCKENGMLVPLLAWIVNATLLRERLGQSHAAVRQVLAAGVILPSAMFAVAFAYELLNVPSFARRDFGMAERLLTQARILCDYLLHIGLPRLSGAGIYFDDYAVSRSVFEPWNTLPALVVVGALLGAAVAARQRAPLFAFGALWFFCGHLLESTALPLELYFEHRNYLPMFGPVLALVGLVAGTSGPPRRLLLAGLSLWTLLLVFIAHAQARAWGDARALAILWAAERPGSERAALHRADFLVRQGEVLGARTFLLGATETQAASTAVPLQVLLIDCQTRHLVTAAEIEFYRNRLATGGFSNATMPAMASVRQLVQRGGCAGMQLRDWLALTDAALANPRFEVKDAQAYFRLERGYAYANEGKHALAAREFALAYAAESSPGMALNIALVMFAAGNLQAAGEWADRASRSRVRGVAGLLSQDRIRARALHEEIRRQTAEQTDQ